MQTEKPILGDRFEQALVQAARWHASQVRKGSDVPYVSHLMSVAAIVLEDGGDEDEAIAALLHDAVEDQGGAVTREIRALFGDRVTEIVDGCTDSDTIPKPPWRQRKEMYIEHLPQASPSVLRVSTADKLHNARSVLMDLRRVGPRVWDRFKGGREGTLWYYRAIVGVLRQFGTHYLTDELDRVVAEIERLDAEMKAD